MDSKIEEEKAKDVDNGGGGAPTTCNKKQNKNMRVSVNYPLKHRPDLLRLIKDAASRAIAQEDVWAKHNIDKIPAERVVRHMYDPETEKWFTDETIVKIEKKPFTNGAMRYCYRMKKMATPPNDATNHRFHSHGWSRASNYVAKCYVKSSSDNNGDGSDHVVIDNSPEAKDAVKNDILLQYEAAHWAQRFNETDPSRKIIFIRAYVIEFVDRPERTMMAVERFIAGKDRYGTGFIKHNTNSGFVDTEQQRITPQVFSAYSFYSSNGSRLVADIQGVGDLFTDPQVLSIDYRFGDGDLGPRGMALFFKTFRHCTFADMIGIPIFPLSRNELKHQIKYDNEEGSFTDSFGGNLTDMILTEYDEIEKDGNSIKTDEDAFLESFAKLDLNRQRRKSLLQVIPKELILSSEESNTEQRSNLTQGRFDEKNANSTSNDIAALRGSIRNSVLLKKTKKPKKHMKRSASDVDEVSQCLSMATKDTIYDHHAFHRKESGEIRARTRSSSSSSNNGRRVSIMKKVNKMIVPDEETKLNIGKVHYHLAMLHGMGRFPEIVPEDTNGDKPSHDVFSALFHLCHASSLYNLSACLSLARVKSGLETVVSDLLKTIVPIDFEGAKDLLRRAMESPDTISRPKAAAGCILYQILHDEGEESTSDITMIQILEDTISFMEKADEESKEAEQHKARIARGGKYKVGDKVEANFACEGTYYTAVIVEVTDDGNNVIVQYDDDGSTENHSVDNVRATKSATATIADEKQHNLFGFPMSDSEALGMGNPDEKCIIEMYALKADLAELKVKTGDKQTASILYEEAADAAMIAGKMKTATTWSLKAAELQE